MRARSIGLVIVMAGFAAVAWALMQTKDYHEQKGPQQRQHVDGSWFCPDGGNCGAHQRDIERYTTTDNIMCLRAVERNEEGFYCHRMEP